MGKMIQFRRDTYKRGVDMCKVIKNIQGKSADEILRAYRKDDSIPIDLEALLLNLGISALPFDFSNIEHNNDVDEGDILGAVVANGDDAVILYRMDDSLNRQRFTIAHELAHCCLHSVDDNMPHVEFRWNVEEENEHEREANVFAGALLIPLHKLQEVYMNLPIPRSTILASKFAVSVNVMEARLNYLKISYYNKDGEAVVYANE
uniref:ImmA/IrrE family metallo-endopeptidase n=1 Tax=Acetatifactor sp. TaxID=1872090 RepID=UPI004055F2D7